MENQRIKVGVVGVGSLGQWHARIYAEMPNAELVGVYDVNTARAEEIARRYKTRVIPSMTELAGLVEAASIVVPADKHFVSALPFIERGVHLLVEKPIATRLDDAAAMLAAAQTRGVILQVGHVERFNPVMTFLESILTRPRFIEAHRLQPYPPARTGQAPRGTEISVVLDLMIHDLEIIMHLVRSPVREFHAVGVPVLSATEDIANVRLEFENGCVANVTTSRISPENLRKIRIFQADAYISLDYEKQSGEIYRKQAERIERSKVPIAKGESLKNELASFLDCVRAHNAPVVGGEQAARALALAVNICNRIREHEAT